MAFWVVRKGCVPDMLPPKEQDHYVYDGRHVAKRRGSGESFDHNEPEPGFSKRARFNDKHHLELVTLDHEPNDHRDHMYGKGELFVGATANPPFIVIREHTSSEDLASSVNENHNHPPHSTHIHLLNPNLPSPAPMERTASGHSISSSDSPPPEEPASLLSDSAAAQLVRKHLSTVNRHARHARILRALIYPKTPSRSRDFTIDDDALESIFSAANDLFFANKLRGRVRWDWSHPDMASAGRYDYSIVGTTALRRRRGPKGGYETLIVLSSPILKDTKYNRRLLISTFLHEMIHSFLFVMCGRKAGNNGGHTEGFRKIAADIDGWVGRECLRLTDMEADLDRFTVDHQCDNDPDANISNVNVTYTELDGHLHHHHGHQFFHQCHEPYEQQQQGYGAMHSDEIETSLWYPSARSHSSQNYSSHQEHGEEWQWQRREGFGVPRHAY